MPDETNDHGMHHPSLKVNGWSHLSKWVIVHTAIPGEALPFVSLLKQIMLIKKINPNNP